VPELPEVETVRRMLDRHVRGRVIDSVRLSGASLRGAIPRGLPDRVRGRAITGTRRHGKYLLLDLEGGVTLLSHLGMSGRWLFHRAPPLERMPHVHVRLGFRDGTSLWFQDPRRFGMLRAIPSASAFEDPALAILGPDPIATPPTAESLSGLARGMRVNVKNFLLDQRRLAGIGNIYASEILYRAAVDPRRRSGALGREEWSAIAAEIPAVLREAIAGMGTTFSAYRTLWNEPGTYGERLFVYDRADEPCRRCGTPIRRIVQGQRSTFYCPVCQRSRSKRSRGGRAPGTRRAPRS
jgi:formamidopyrimidine-DNA glycosylase